MSSAQGVTMSTMMTAMRRAGWSGVKLIVFAAACGGDDGQQTGGTGTSTGSGSSGNGSALTSDNTDDGDVHASASTSASTSADMSTDTSTDTDGTTSGDSGTADTEDDCGADCAESFTPIWTIATGAVVSDLATSPDGRVFAAGRLNGAWALSLDSDGIELDSTIIPSPTPGAYSFTGISYGPGDSLWASATVFLPVTGFLQRAFGAASVDFESSSRLERIATHADGAYVFGRLSGGALEVYHFDAAASLESLVPALDPTTCSGEEASRGPVVNGAGEVVFACWGTAGSWYIHHYAPTGEVIEVEAVEPPEDITAIAIDDDGDLYFAGGDEFEAYVGSYEFATGGGWTTLSTIGGDLRYWSGIEVAPDGETLVVVGAVVDARQSLGAALRLTTGGDQLTLSSIEDFTSLDHLALGPNGEVYAAGRQGGPTHTVVRLTP